jgi:hypothetical protein
MKKVKAEEAFLKLERKYVMRKYVFLGWAFQIEKRS